MLSFLRDVFNIKLRLGYLLFCISVAAFFLSLHKVLVPGTVVHTRVASPPASANPPIHAAAAAAPLPAQSPPSSSGSHKPLSVNAPQLASIQRYIDATAPICSAHITSAIGTDPALGIEPDIAQWCAPCRGLRALLRAHLPTQRNRYLDSHKETQDAAKSSGQAVAMESGGNGWVYTDADVLGMVAPLKFAADDRFAACARGAARAAADARAA